MLGCNFIKKETPTQVFPCKFCNIFESTSLMLQFETPNYWVSLSFFILSQYLLFCTSFGSCFCPTYLVIMIIQIHFLYLRLSVNKSPPVFFFNRVLIKEKKQENSSECFPLSLGETLINCILIKSSPQPPKQQNQKCL